MRSRFLGLLRFGLFAGGFLYKASRNLAELFDARLKLLLFGDARRGFFGGLAQGHFESRCLPAKSARRVALHGDSRGKVSGLAFGLFDFNREPQGARIELSGLFAIEGDAILGAVEIEGGLAKQVLRLAKRGIELVRARAEPLLLGLHLVDGARFALFGGIHVAEQVFESRGLDIEVLRFARENDAQQAAHLFAQLGVAAGFRSLALERRELLLDFDENVVDAGEIEL